MLKIFFLDNYDSFSFNLVQYLGELGAEVEVVRNDVKPLSTINLEDFDAIVISPGPGTPDRAGISIPLIKKSAPQLPILGVCLGHQAIAICFGGKIVQANYPMHGKTSSIQHDQSGIFKHIPSPFVVNRYHSLVMDKTSLENTPNLIVTAYSEDGCIMSIQHQYYPTFGVQFHPESIFTEHGHQLLQNFLDISESIKKKRISAYHDEFSIPS
ncbi:MAG: aminodeoxychorismate/anthranilate synthase component II [Gammaproteobacteria bacterium]|nr:aminodeoxychorismate/anthranilate synthase component II [Gammaproteobacteria bacterium]